MDGWISPNFNGESRRVRKRQKKCQLFVNSVTTTTFYNLRCCWKTDPASRRPWWPVRRSPRRRFRRQRWRWTRWDTCRWAAWSRSPGRQSSVHNIGNEMWNEVQCQEPEFMALALVGNSPGRSLARSSTIIFDRARAAATRLASHHRPHSSAPPASTCPPLGHRLAAR